MSVAAAETRPAALRLAVNHAFRAGVRRKDVPRGRGAGRRLIARWRRGVLCARSLLPGFALFHAPPNRAAPLTDRLPPFTEVPWPPDHPLPHFEAEGDRAAAFRTPFGRLERFRWPAPSRSRDDHPQQAGKRGALRPPTIGGRHGPPLLQTSTLPGAPQPLGTLHRRPAPEALQAPATRFRNFRAERLPPPARAVVSSALRNGLPPDAGTRHLRASSVPASLFFGFRRGCGGADGRGRRERWGQATDLEPVLPAPFAPRDAARPTPGGVQREVRPKKETARKRSRSVCRPRVDAADFHSPQEPHRSVQRPSPRAPTDRVTSLGTLRRAMAPSPRPHGPGPRASGGRSAGSAPRAARPAETAHAPASASRRSRSAYSRP